MPKKANLLLGAITEVTRQMSKMAIYLQISSVSGKVVIIRSNIIKDCMYIIWFPSEKNSQSLILTYFRLKSTTFHSFIQRETPCCFAVTFGISRLIRFFHWLKVTHLLQVEVASQSKPPANFDRISRIPSTAHIKMD